MQQLRPTTHEDLVCIVEWEHDPDTSAWLGEVGRDWHERAIADPEQDHIVAGSDGARWGFAVLAGIHDTDRVLELRRIVVNPTVRRAGRGRALLRLALARAYEQHRARRVWLDVKAHNARARALYESEGFTVTDVLTDAITEQDGTSSDLVVMVHRPQ